MNWQELVEGLEAIPNQTLEEAFDLGDVEHRPPYVRSAELRIRAREIHFYRTLKLLVNAAHHNEKRDASKHARLCERLLEEIEELYSAWEPDAIERPHDPLDFAA